MHMTTIPTEICWWLGVSDRKSPDSESTEAK